MDDILDPMAGMPGGELLTAGLDIEVEEQPLEVRLDKKMGRELHDAVLTKLKQRRDFSVRNMETRYDDWDRTREHLGLYADLTRKARKTDRSSDEDSLELPFDRAIVIPLETATLHVLLAQVMSIHGSRNPMLQVTGVGAEDINSAYIIEAMLEHDMRQTQGFSCIHSMHHDALAFGCGVLFDSWQIEHGMQNTFEPIVIPGIPHEMLVMLLGKRAYVPARKWGQLREYNRWRKIDPYLFRADPRVSLSDLQNGEFVGHQFDESYLNLKASSGDNGPYFNIGNLPKKSKLYSDKYDNKPQPEGLNDFQPEKSSDDESDRGFFTCEYMEIMLIPSDWDLGTSEYPERWVFAWADDDVIIRAHPKINAHGRFSYSVAESDPSFHDSFSQGAVEQLDGMQRFMNWLFNARAENVIRTLNNQWVYSPRLLEQVDIEYGGPGENIRMTSEAVEMIVNGELDDVRRTFFQVPVQDVTSGSYMESIQYVHQMAQMMTGANDPLSGIPTPTERTATEVGTITAKASDRIAIMARLIDELAIAPIVARAIANRQQFTSTEQFYRVVGDLAAIYGVEQIYAGLMDIQGQYDYVPNIGTAARDPERDAMTWMNTLSAAAQMPQLMQPGPDGKMIDFRKLFLEKVAVQSGARNIHNYMVQVIPPEQLQQQVQAGNVVPMQGGEMVG